MTLLEELRQRLQARIDTFISLRNGVPANIVVTNIPEVITPPTGTPVEPTGTFSERPFGFRLSVDRK